MRAIVFRSAVLAALLGVCLGGTHPSDSQPAAGKDISEITLVRYGNAGSPADVLTFHSDGSIFYEGKHDTIRVGAFNGKLRDNFSGKTFPQLANLAASWRKPSGPAWTMAARLGANDSRPGVLTSTRSVRSASGIARTLRVGDD